MITRFRELSDLPGVKSFKPLSIFAQPGGDQINKPCNYLYHCDLKVSPLLYKDISLIDIQKSIRILPINS